MDYRNNDDKKNLHRIMVHFRYERLFDGTNAADR